MRGAVDFETSHWTQPLCAALAYGEKGARTVEFLHAKRKKDRPGLPLQVLTQMAKAQQTHGVKTWWAHNGGKFDWLMLVETTLREKWKWSGGLSGDGRALEICLTPPKHLGGKENRIHLRDSMAIVPQRLKHKKKKCEGCCACDWGLDREGVFTKDDYRIDPSRWQHARLEQGCKKDATLVLDLLDAVETALEDFGTHVQTTFSMSALDCVKHELGKKGLTLPSHGGRKITDGQQRLNQLCANAYYGGRVEVFRHWYRGLLTEIDRNSSYPAAMTQSLPWECLGKATTRAQLSAILKGTEEGVLHATVHVPDDIHIPVLPVKNVPRFPGKNGKTPTPLKGIFFPTGTFSGWWPAPLLRYAVKVGAAQILQLHDGVRYTSQQPFAEFIAHAYEMKSKTHGAQRAFWKLILNAVYGKFAQSPERENLAAFSDAGEAMHFMHKTSGKPVDQGATPRVIAWKKTSWPAHTHYALASYVTAYAQIALHEALMLADTPCYCDTDSVHAAISSDFESIKGAKLGEWKVELARCYAEFFAPKLYCQVEPNGKVHTAAKGFPTDADSFQRLVMGEVLNIDRIRLLKSQLRGDGSFKRMSGSNAADREWRGHSRKRKPLPNGDTVPWAYEELQMDAPAYAESPAYQRILKKVEAPLKAAAAKVRREKRAQRHTR